MRYNAIFDLYTSSKARYELKVVLLPCRVYVKTFSGFMNIPLADLSH